MSQIYPSPTIYTYRARGFGVNPGVQAQITPPNGIPYGTNAIPLSPAWYIIEFSSNSGVAWAPASNYVFHSLQESYQQIANIVNNEAYFAANTASIVAQPQTFAYPV